jgi:osmotically-inducible protein OsmY
MTEGTMRIDSEIQSDVLQEIRWEPSLQDKDIAVGVQEGVVTLGGFAASYRDKLLAERIAGRVKGVKGIANEIQVRLPQSSERPDPEIARAAIDAIAWHIAVPDEGIQVKVEHGWLRLVGEVDWYYQKEAAEKAVRSLTGVKGVSNLITVRPRATPGGVRERIRETLLRGAEFDAEHIAVEIEGGKAILRGTVRAYAEKRDAERAARNAPGVIEVDNQLVIDPYAGAAL